MLRIGAFRGHLLSASALVSVLSVTAASAGALPGNGHYVAGKGEIGNAGQSLMVKQSSTTGIINWNSFSVGSKNSVTFNNGSGATLNRVTGGNLSKIAGSLHATGSLYLMNSAGVIVSGTGKVVTGGSFAASSGDIAGTFGDSRFKTGTARVVNKGTIVAGGSVTLNGSAVSDTGSIRAAQVSLKAADTLNIDGNITARNADGAGGTVTARALVIDVSGHIVASATKAGKTGGSISIVARDTTTVSGAIAANGGAHGTGGVIETSGKHVHIADSAQISTLAHHGVTGTWLIDPQDFTIAPSGGDITGAALSGELATTDVDIKSSNGANAGNGNIFVDDTVSWSSSRTLTLDAYNSIEANAPITVSGGGGLVFIDGDTANNGVSHPDEGSFLISNGGIISFTGGSGSGATLSIDNASYTLLYSMSDVQAINANLQGNYALAKSLDATSTTGWIPIGTDGAGNIGNSGYGFTGVFDGFGHTISNLTVNIGSNDYAGLFGYSSGIIRNVGLIGGSVSGRDYVGGLVGANEPEGQSGVINSYATGAVTGRNYVGGLVGLNTDVYFGDDGSEAIGNSHATGPVSGSDYVGGLAGESLTEGGTDGGSNFAIGGSYATGNVSGDDDVGGLVGENTTASIIAYTYATGTVTGSGSDVGGLVGWNIKVGTNASAYIYHGYATGSVSGGNMVGGLVGENDGGTIGGDGGAIYATGSVSGSEDVGGLLGENVGKKFFGGYATGSVSGGNNVGGLVGENNGDGFLGYATGSVSGGDNVGGLVGNNDANAVIDYDYSTGSVSGTGADVGGLVGANSGTVKYSYAMGLVSGGADVGGLVGSNSGKVEYSYAIGTVIGTGDVGGLIGLDSGTVKDSYFDTQTSGIGTTHGAGNVTSDAGIGGLTTAQLQSGLPSGFSDQEWLIVAGVSFPYLGWQLSSVYTPQVVSGYALSGYGGTGVSGVTVDALENGVALSSALTGGAVTSYADGYYYYLLAPGSIGAGDDVLTYRTGSAAMSDTGGSVSGLNLYSGYLNDVTGAANYSTVKSDLTSAIGGNSTAQSIVNGLGNLAIDASGTGFNIDSAIDLGTGTLVLTSAGTIAQSSAGAITAKTLTGRSVGMVVLTSASNAITDLGSFTTGGPHHFTLTDDHDLTVDGTVNAGGHEIALTTRGSGHDIAVDVKLEAGMVDLVSAATITESSAGDIDATTLEGSSVSTAEMNSAKNTIADLGAFTTGSTFELTDDHNLAVDGTVNAGAHGIHLTTTGSGHGIAVDAKLKGSTVDLVSSATISENGSGDIDATRLEGSSAGAAKLTSAKNTLTDLDAFTSGSTFELTDGHNLRVDGTVNAGTHNADLTTTGSGHDIAVDAKLEGATVNLVSASKATESSAGAIIANLLNVTADTGITLTSSKNKIKKLGTDHTTSGPNHVTL